MSHLHEAALLTPPDRQRTWALGRTGTARAEAEPRLQEGLSHAAAQTAPRRPPREQLPCTGLSKESDKTTAEQKSCRPGCTPLPMSTRHTLSCLACLADHEQPELLGSLPLPWAFRALKEPC